MNYMEIIDAIMDCDLSDELKLDIIYRLAIGMDKQLDKYNSFLESIGMEHIINERG